MIEVWASGLSCCCVSCDKDGSPVTVMPSACYSCVDLAALLKRMCSKQVYYRWLMQPHTHAYQEHEPTWNVRSVSRIG
jgi:hypothetical protein